jgi:hypothetical protein
VRQAGGGLLVKPSVDSIAAGVLAVLRAGPPARYAGSAVTWQTTAHHTIRTYREVTS